MSDQEAQWLFDAITRISVDAIVLVVAFVMLKQFLKLNSMSTEHAPTKRSP